MISISRTSFLYIGDIGDNLGKKKEKKIYWFEEPGFFSSERVTDIHQMKIHMEQGLDMEAMLVDPLSKDVLLFSKRENSITMYKTERLNSPQFELKKVCHLPHHLYGRHCPFIEGRRDTT